MANPGTPPDLPPSLRWLHRFVRWFLVHLYTDLAWAYDLVAIVTSMGLWWRWQTAVDDALPEGPMLEIAHGTGRLLHRQLQASRSVFGIDLSRQMIDITRRRLASSHLPLRIARARVEALPFADATFSAAYATFPSDFILEAASVSEILRVLKREGSLIIVPAAWITGERPWDRVASWLYRVTGQAPTNLQQLDWLNTFRVPGANLHWEIIEQARSQVLRVRITRASPSRGDEPA